MRHPRSDIPFTHRVVQNTLVIDLGAVHRVLSSAPCGGGLTKVRSLLNHQVAMNPLSADPLRPRTPVRKSAWNDPARDLGSLALRLGAKLPCVGLMTAVPMKRLVTVRKRLNGVWVACFCTVGVTNAVKAGEPAYASGAGSRCCPAGTINIILLTNARLSVSAMVGAVQVATEAKTAALHARRVPSRSGHPAATGTGTDAVVVAAPLHGAPIIHYSGTHTMIGSLVGRVVSQAVEQGLNRAQIRDMSVRQGTSEFKGA